jgi:hypothetical protein
MKADFTTHRFQMDNRKFLKKLRSTIRICKETDVNFRQKEVINYCIFGL